MLWGCSATEQTGPRGPCGSQTLWFTVPWEPHGMGEEQRPHNTSWTGKCSTRPRTREYLIIPCHLLLGPAVCLYISPPQAHSELCEDDSNALCPTALSTEPCAQQVPAKPLYDDWILHRSCEEMDSSTV